MSRSAGRIGWFLVWAVVFCDIGTSVYYVPGLLFETTGNRAGFFVLSTIIAFVLLSIKVVEVTRRFTSGGGVVSVADAAFGPWWGCLGGQLILVDYFLTVAISAASGVYYIDSIYPLGDNIVPAIMAGLAVLCGLNIVGVKESATASMVLASAAFLVDAVVIVTALVKVPPEVWAAFLEEFSKLRELPPWAALVGYSGAWLAFSGLESLSQLAPAMRDVNETPRKGMIAVVISVILTAPAMTFLSTLALSDHVKHQNAERFISELGWLVGGYGLKLAVVLTASALLLFAANTAIIGAYHVQIAMTRRSFFPEGLSALSHRFQTPYRAIILCTLIPAAVILFAHGDMSLMGELYAFGLLGAFVMTSVGVDVLRWRDGQRGAMFWLGVFTSVAVVTAFGVNLIHKERATFFGGGLTLLGMGLAWMVRSGALERLMEKIPRMAPPKEVDRVEQSFLTLSQIALQPRDAIPGVLVASRGATKKIFKEAVDRAAARGQKKVYLLYVDEVPGLFFPQLAKPTPEGLTVLEAGATILQGLGVEAVPVWALSHNAAATVAEAAEVANCDTVVIGATQRTFLWHAMRGRFIQDALRQLPAEIRLVVVG